MRVLIDALTRVMSAAWRKTLTVRHLQSQPGAQPSTLTSPLAVYHARVANSTLRADPGQRHAIKQLTMLWEKLQTYKQQTSHLARFFGSQPPPPPSFYLHGNVGGGKSMLMDVFFEVVPVKRKRRIHFHEFLRDFHVTTHKRRRDNKGGDPIAPLVRQIVDDHWLLCLDELEILDIADAMVVGRIFQALLAAGAVIVTTSNRAPEDLYKDGLQREKFLPFIRLIQERFDVFQLTTAADYRLSHIQETGLYYSPLGDKATQQMDQLFAQVTAGRLITSDTVVVSGREITVTRACGDIARFLFKDLCETPLAAADYIQIATRYDTILVDDVPLLSPANRDAARRFVMLVDALYEYEVMLAMSAAAEPQRLYPSGDGAFEFQRTASRLMEMRSKEYLASH